MTDVTTVGRLQLDHPDLGHPGGADLHNHVRSAWTKLADNMDSRFFTHDALADAAFIDFNHNFKTAFDELRINLYSRNTGTGELTRIESGGSPDLDDFTIAATTGSETVSVRVTNNTGGPQDIAAVIVHGKSAEKLNDLDDVDTVTTPPALGQTLVYDGSLFVPGAASGGGEVNSIDNWNAEADTTGWATYKDGAAAEPTDGTGGSPSIVLSVQSAVALRGAQSFKLAKDAANRQGEGFSYDFSIAEQDQSKKLKIQFDFKTDEDAGYASGDLTVYIYDVDNTQLITPVDTDIDRGVNIFQTSFNSTTSTNYRLIFHIATVNATAWDAYVDNVIVGPGMTSQGAVVGGWEDFTPVINNLSTANESGKYRRVGENVEVMVTADVTGAATGIITFDLPASLTIDTSKIPDVTTAGSKFSPIGSAYMVGATYESGTVVVEGTPSIQVVGPSTGAVWNASQPLVWANGNDLGVHFVVPVTQWANQGIVPMLSEDNLSEWTAYTPSGFTGGEWGTSTSINTEYRRVGDSIEIRGYFTTGTTTANEAQIDLPLGLTIGGVGSDTIYAGRMHRDITTSSVLEYSLLATAGDTYFNVGKHQDAVSSNIVDPANASDLSGSGVRFMFASLLIPVQEYAGSQNSLVGYSLYNPDVQTGLVDSKGLKGHSNGAAIAEGYVGEKKTSYTTTQLVVAAYKTVGTLNLTAGVWLLKGTSIQSDFTATRFYVGAFSTSIDTGGSVTDGTASPKATDYDTATGGGGVTHVHTLNLSSDQTWYFNVYVSAINGANSCYNYYEAIRIA